MYCLIAAEPGAAEIIIDNLRNRYPDWRFEAVTDAERLFQYAGERPDVVLVSRFLPGDDPSGILRRLTVEFHSSHIVLLTGVLNEQAKTYIRQAQKYGMGNVVTGKLPGDRPYTIFEALTQARREMFETGLEWDEGTVEEELIVMPEMEQEEVFRPVMRPEPEHYGYGNYYRRRRSSGNLILVAANKGGVGKTTVAISLSMALARAGIPVCLADFDFGGPNVAVFFDVRNKPGIEALAGKKHVDRFLPDLLVRVEKNLVILPGPMDKTLPYFEPGQLVEVVDTLSEEYLVIGDTPPEFWTKPWLEGLFPRADIVLAVVDQSKFSESETRDYAPKLILMGVEPSRIRIVCNRFSSKLHSVKKVEAFFNAGLKAKKGLPGAVAVIPEGWEDFVKAGYKKEIALLEDTHSPWRKLAEKVAGDLDIPLRSRTPEKKKMFSFLKRG